MPLARRPTPSHDAAQVLVSFHQNGTPVELADDTRRLSGGPRASRPLALANVTRPPQNRRRVWRACESCRKKKIKCDGSDPCQCCLDTASECVYAGDGFRRGFVDAQVLEVYGKRLRALEDLVTNLVDEQQRLAAQLALQKDTTSTVSRDVTSTLREQHDTVAAPFSQDVPLPPSDPIVPQEQFTPITQLVPSDTTDTIDPELVSSSADESHAVPLDLPNPSVGSILQTAHADKNDSATAPMVYSDDYGTLAADGTDGAKYVGLGATVLLMDDCPGIRTRVRQELLQKGHQPQESLLSPSIGCEAGMKAESSPIDRTEHLPPVPLMDTLIDTFFRKVYKLFPIIEAEDFRRQYLMLRYHSGSRSGFVELLYSVLAVSSPHISPDDPVWSRPGCSAYRCLDLGDHFYSLAVAAVGAHEQHLSWMTSFTVQDPSINTVTAFTLLGMHLTQLGRLNEAWRIVGHAVRLGYEMGLHRSPKRMGLPLLDIKRRCQLWWCLYVMDRLLALHLGRPLAIHDADSDVFFPSARPQAPGFVAMTHLCKIIGEIHQLVNTVQQARRWSEAGSDGELQGKVDELWHELQAWKDTKLPCARVETSPDTSRITERCVLLSTYCSAVHLLFRTYMATPHRVSRLPFEQALKESFQAAIECIDMTEVFLSHVPVCHYYSFHGQNLVVSIATLLHCRRQTEDERTAADAREHSQRGMRLLARMDTTWPMAQRYRAILTAYETLTREMVHRGSPGRCICDSGCLVSKDKTPLDPWQEFAAQIDFESNLFPSMPDTAWMDELFHLSPTSAPDIVECPTPPLSQPEEDDRPCKRRRTGGSVCAFTFKQR